MLWALVILFVVLITGAVVMRSDLAIYTQTQERALKRRAHWLAESGVERFLAELNDTSRDPRTLIERRFTDSISENESITRTLYPWAGTLLAVSIGRVGTVSDTSSEIIGQESDLPDSVIVRTRNPHYPLVLSGSTNSEGLVTSVAGQPTSGLFLGRGPTQSRVDSWTYRGEDTPSAFDPWLMKHELENLKGVLVAGTPQWSGALRLSGVDLSEAFTEDTTIIDGDLELVNCTLSVAHVPRFILATGNISIRERTLISGRAKLWSAESVFISGNAIIDKAALISDSVTRIEEDAVFRGHLLSGYAISVADRAKLVSNSTISAYLSGESGRSTPIHSILVSSGANLDCFVGSFADSTLKAADIPRIKVDTGVSFSGMILSNHFIESYSDVVADFDVDGFWFKKSSTTYVNWIADRWLREESGQAYPSPWFYNEVRFSRSQR